MSIHDFHSKLVSGKDEGSLIEALRRLNSLESSLAIAEQDPGLWNEWADGSGPEADGLMAKARS